MERIQLPSLIKTDPTNTVQVKDPKLPPRRMEIYETLPFTDFDKRADIVKIIKSAGFKEVFIEGEEGAVFFNHEINVKAYHDLTDRRIFTIREDNGGCYIYSPSAFICKFNYEGKAPGQVSDILKSKGYGNYTKAYESRTIKRILFQENKKLPNDFSEQSKKQFEQERARIKQEHPYGIFWEFIIGNDGSTKCKINKELLLRVLHDSGYRIHNEDPVKLEWPFVYRTERLTDSVRGYIKVDDENEELLIKDSVLSVMQRNGNFLIENLQPIADKDFMRDSSLTAYLKFQNGFIEITTKGIHFKGYEDADGLIWHDSLIKRDWKEQEEVNSVYLDFLKKAIRTGINEYLKKIIGYLVHGYKEKGEGYLITLTEECEDPEDGGGSGKNIFVNILKEVTTIHTKPGSQAKFDEKFFQSWNRQKIFFIADVDKNFNYEFLKEPSTGSFIWKRLFKDEKEMDSGDAPKFIINTNYSYDGKDGGLKRRIIPLEFTNYFTLAGGVDTDLGKRFPRDWSDDDWTGFFQFIIDCIGIWLKSDRKMEATELSPTGWLKNFEQNHGKNSYRFVSEKFNDIFNISEVDSVPIDVSTEIMKETLREWFEKENISKIHQPDIKTINKALKDWGKRQGYEIRTSVTVYADVRDDLRRFVKKKVSGYKILPVEPPF